MPARLENIQALRAVAALLVVLIHFHGAEKEYAGAGQILARAPDLAFSAIDLFFLFSGFVLARGSMGQSASWRDGGKFLVKRALRVYPVYWLVMGLFLLLFVGNWLVFGEPVRAPNLLADLLLVPTGERTFLVVSWTLSHEIYFYLMFGVLLMFGRAWLLPLLAAWGAVVLLAGLAGWGQVAPLWGVIFHPLTYDFLAGCLVSYLVYGGVQRYGRLAFGAGLVWFGAVAVFRAWFGGVAMAQEAEGWNIWLSYGAPATLVLYGVAVMEITKGLRAPRWLVLIGDRSYTLYLIHVPVIMVLGKALSPLAGPGVWDSVVLFGLWALAIGVATNLFYRFAEQPLGRWANQFLDKIFAEPVGVSKISRTV